MSKSERLERKAARQQKERERIIDGALAVIIKHGAAGLSIGKVAKRVDMLPSNLYYYFKSVDAIYDALTVRLLEEESAFVNPQLRKKTGLAVLMALIDVRIKYYMKHHDAFLILYQRQTPMAPEVLEEHVYPASYEMMGLLEQALKALQAEGGANTELDARKVSNLAFLLSNGILSTAIFMQRAGGNMKFNTTALANEAKKLFLAALTP